MPNYQDIIADPEYQAANAATKQAIFDYHVGNNAEYQGTDAATKQAIMSAWGIAPTMRAAPIAPAAPELESGIFESFGRGVRSYAPAVKETFGGLQALTGKAMQETLGAGPVSTGLMQSGVERIKAASKQTEQQTRPGEASFTQALDQGIGTVLSEWLPYQVGSGASNLLESLGLMGAGAIIGSAVAPGAGTAAGAIGPLVGKELAKRGVREAALKIAQEQGEDAAKAYFEKEAIAAGKKVARNIGATSALAGQAAGYGFGQTASRAVESAIERGEQPEDIDLSRVLPAGLVSTAAEFISDKIGLGALKGLKKEAQDAIKSEVGTVLSRSVKAAGDMAKGIAITGTKEAPTEVLQSIAERYGAKLDLADKQAIDEYINAVAASYAMSVVPGAIGGVRQKPVVAAEKPVAPKPEEAIAEPVTAIAPIEAAQPEPDVEKRLTIPEMRAKIDRETELGAEPREEARDIRPNYVDLRPLRTPLEQQQALSVAKAEAQQQGLNPEDISIAPHPKFPDAMTLVRRPLAAEDFLEEVRGKIKTEPLTTPADLARIRDEHETAVINSLLEQDKKMQAVSDLSRANLERMSAIESMGAATQDADRRVREGRLLGRVQSLIDQNIPFASTAIADINRKFEMIGETPLDDTERSRVQNIMTMAQGFTDFVKLPSLPVREQDQFAENQAMEALIKEKKPIPTQPMAPAEGSRLTAKEQAEIGAQQPPRPTRPSAEDLLAEVRGKIKAAPPATAADIARFKDDHETAVINALLEQDRKMEAPAKIARANLEKLSQEESMGAAVKDASKKVREGRLIARVQSLIDQNIQFGSSAISDINRKLELIGEAPLDSDERQRIQNIMAMARAFMNFVNLPMLPVSEQDVFAENQAMEALIKERKPSGQVSPQPVRTEAPAPSQVIQEAPVSTGIEEGRTLRPEGGIEPGTTEDRQRVDPIAPIEAKPVTPQIQSEQQAKQQHAVQGLGIVEIPVNEVQLSKDVPQFKSDADQAGVVERLEGKFERTGVAPIQIWRRRNGRLEVISGRHRLDLAQRTGEATIPAQIHDEASGFDTTKAATLDAELNIRDGQGKVKDYVVYFEKSGITEDEAKSRGLLGRALGKRAWTISSKGSPELIAAHRGNVIDDSAAEAIASTVPNDERLQVVGIKSIQDGKSTANAVNMIQAVRAMTQEKVADTTFDMFGFDDSAIKEAENMAKAATQKQAEIDNRLRAISGAAKRPDIAKKEGVDVRDPNALKTRIEELKKERAAWDNWATNPDLVAEVRQALQPTTPEGEGKKSLRADKAQQLSNFEQTLRATLNKFGLKDIGLKLINGMTADGSYAQQLIQIAADSTNPIRTLRHEAIHALRELGFFTDAQWKSLSTMAKDKWIDQYLKQRNIDGKPLKAGEESRYDAYMREYDGNMEKITEEAVADAFADFDATKPPAGLMSALLTRMRNLFQAIKSALTKVESPEQIFGKVERGELKAGVAAKKGEAEGVSKSLRKIPEAIEATARKIESKLPARREPMDTDVYDDIDNQELLSEINKRFHPKDESFVDKALSMRENFWERLAQKTVDKYLAIKKYSPIGYMVARMSNAYDGAVEGLLFHGEVFNDGGALNIKDNTQGLFDALKPLGKEVDRFLIWMAMSRDANLPADKRSFSQEILDAKDDLVSGKINGKNRAQVYNDVRMKMNKLNRSVLNVALDAGIIDSSQAKIADLKKRTKLTAEDKYKLTANLRQELTDLEAEPDSDIDAISSLRKKIRSIESKTDLDDNDRADLIEYYEQNPGAYERFSNDLYYVPLYKEGPDGELVPTSGERLTSQFFSKELKGNKDLAFGDLMQNIVVNWSHILSASMKNVAANKILEDTVRLGAAAPSMKNGYEYDKGTVYRVTKKGRVDLGPLRGEYTTKEKGSIKVMQDGSPVYYQVSDELLMESIAGITQLGPKSKFIEIGSAFKNALQYGVTIAPGFRVRNLIRDSAAAVGIADIKMDPVSNAIEGINLFDPNNKYYIGALAGGGIMQFANAYDGHQSRNLKRLIKMGVPDDTVLDSKEKIANGLKFLFNKYEEWGNKAENANRLSIYKQLRDRGMSHLEASFQARDLMDFSLHGSSMAFRHLTMVIPFLNARIQGLYKIGRDGVTPTYRLMYSTVTGKEIEESDRIKAERFSIVAMSVGLASALLYLTFKDDEEFKKREQWDRDNFWWIRLPGMEYALRIPKPFELGAFGTLVERTLEQIADDGAEGKVFTQAMGRMLNDTFAVNPIPQMFKPLLDIYANKDAFTGSPIETSGLEKLSRQERTTDTTSPLAKALGGVTEMIGTVTTEKVALSPVQVDYLIKGYFGWLGAQATAISYYAAAPFTRGAYPDTKMAETFSVGFLKSLPANQSKYVTSFYENNKDIQQALADMRHYASLGDSDEVAKIMEKKQDMIALAKIYDNYSDDMSKMRKYIRLVTSDKDMSGAQKRVEIDRAKQIIAEIAKQAEDVRLSMKK